jgi:hypothetical protein
MEINEKLSLEEKVNRRGSRLWTLMNDNSKASKNRDRFVAENGGMFLKNGRYWQWTTPVAVHNGYKLKRVDTGEICFFMSMTEFGQKNGMTPVKICELLNGKRKTYKGWTAVEIREVKESVGSHVKEKEPEKEKIKIFNGATFKDTVTGKVFYIENISKFAKENNINKGNLYKVATGKMKTYKNLKLYNPLED